MSLAIAERRVDRRSSWESPLVMGVNGVQGSSAVQGCPDLWSEQAIMQVQPSIKREFPWKQGYVDLQDALALGAK